MPHSADFFLLVNYLMLLEYTFEISRIPDQMKKVMRHYFFFLGGRWRPQSASEVFQLYMPELGMARAFQIGMALCIWLKIGVSRPL